MQLVIVTGMSGAGKSRVIDNLEDIGFFCVDNMTPKLIPTFVQLLKDSSEEREKVAIVADIRLGGSFSHLFNAIEELKNIDCNVKILFIDADNEVILRRYQETRRKHPLLNYDDSHNLQDIIIKEREILKKARDIAKQAEDNGEIIIEKPVTLAMNEMAADIKD